MQTSLTRAELAEVMSVETLRRLRMDLARAQVRDVDTRGPYTIQLALRNRDGSAFRLEVEVVGDAPYPIARIGVSAVPGADDPPSGYRLAGTTSPTGPFM